LQFFFPFVEIGNEAAAAATAKYYNRGQTQGEEQKRTQRELLFCMLILPDFR
jgi:hypothetical protein